MKIQLALIHNHNQKRNSKIIPNLEQLSRTLAIEHKVSFAQIGFQPALPDIKPHDRIARERLLRSVEDEWRTYLKMKPVGRNADEQLNAKGSVTAAIETCLTDKHIRAWDIFAESDLDILICFEDDAVFTSSSVERLLKILRFVDSLPTNKGIYADLAGGLPLAILGIGELVLGLYEEMLFFERPVSNTACSYLINKTIAADFKKRLLENPSYRLIPADWLLNKLFIDQLFSAISTNCFHACPPVFQHGSIVANDSSVRITPR